MIELIEGLPAPVVGMRASGRITKEDYRGVVEPAVDGAIAAHGRVRLLYVLGEDLDGYSLGAIWEDTKLGAGHLRAWERVAVVTDAGWVVDGLKVFGWMVPGDFRRFSLADEPAAREWLAEGADG